MNPGSDGFATDPWKTDTDADGWSDGYETLTKGTNPLAWDTDGDGVRDSSDLDPLHNLLVAVRVNYVHHGASPWCTPELVGIIRVNDDYTWVSQHVGSTLDSFTSWACPPLIPTTQYSTSYFGYTYYADVPDDVSSVSLRATAWAINPGRGDDILVDAFVQGGYTLNSGTSYQTLWNGNSWYSFDIWTVALPKAKTLFVTDGNATITLANGQSRLVGQDRYYVFTFAVTSAYGPFVVGINAIVVPRSIFLDSKLRADFDAGTFAPLTDATLYGEDLGQSKVSESVAGTIAKALSGVDAKNVLDRLLRNTTNVLVYSYVDVTSYVVLLDLPADVVKILPWASVSIGPTGAMPQDFWQKIGAAASTVVNSLVYVGQMIYKGLVALGTFLVNLAEAIVDWGMKALGAVWNTIVAVAQKAGEVLGQFLDAIIQAVINGVNSALAGLLAMVNSLLARTLGLMVFDLEGAVANPDPAAAESSLNNFLSTLETILLIIALVPVAVTVAFLAFKALTLGVSWLIETAVSEGVVDFIISTLVLTAFSLAVGALFTMILEAMSWVEDQTAAFFATIAGAAATFSAVAKVEFRLYETLFVKTSKDITSLQRWKGFGLAVVGLLLVGAGILYARTGLARLAIDVLGFLLSTYGFFLYLSTKAKHDIILEITEFVSPLSSAIVKWVTLLSPTIVGLKIAATAATEGYQQTSGGGAG